MEEKEPRWYRVLQNSSIIGKKRKKSMVSIPHIQRHSSPLKRKSMLCCLILSRVCFQRCHHQQATPKQTTWQKNKITIRPWPALVQRTPFKPCRRQQDGSKNKWPDKQYHKHPRTCSHPRTSSQPCQRHFHYHYHHHHQHHQQQQQQQQQ